MSTVRDERDVVMHLKEASAQLRLTCPGALAGGCGFDRPSGSRSTRHSRPEPRQLDPAGRPPTRGCTPPDSAPGQFESRDRSPRSPPRSAHAGASNSDHMGAHAAASMQHTPACCHAGGRYRLFDAPSMGRESYVRVAAFRRRFRNRSIQAPSPRTSLRSEKPRLWKKSALPESSMTAAVKSATALGRSSSRSRAIPRL